MISFVWLALAAALQGVGAPSRPRQLPAVTGRYPVGRAVFHWTDSSRSDPSNAGAASRRQIEVIAWYPAERGGRPHPVAYFPDIARIAQALPDSLVHAEFGAATGAVLGGKVVPLAAADPPAADPPGGFPVLVFSHGFDESSFTYAAQLADLASHGYAVFAIEHPHDAFAVELDDGEVVPFAASAWDSALTEPRGAVRYQLAQIPVRAADLSFALDHVVRLARGGSAFAGRLDLGRVGAFGHSLGGMAAATACRNDLRFRACLNEDADDAGRPYDGGVNAPAIHQPFAFFATGHSIYVSPRTPKPTDADLVRMKLTRASYDSIVARYQKNQDEAMASFRGGAWEILAEAPDFTHRTFIDLRTLQATGDSTFERQIRYLEVIRRYVRGFFDRTLGVARDTAFDHAGVIDSLITVRRFPPW